MVQAYDILMGKIDLEDSENEEEFDKVLSYDFFGRRRCRYLFDLFRSTWYEVLRSIFYSIL